MRDWYFNNKQNTHDERGYRTMSWTSWPDEYEKIVNRIENDKYKPTTLDEQHLAEKAYKRLNVFWKLQLAAVVVTVMTMLTEITLSVYVYNPQALSTTVVVLGVQTTGVFVYRVEARKSAKWCAGLVRMCRYVQYGSRGRQTGRFEGARARG